MAQLVVRDLEDDVKARLKRRAARHRRSMEAEARDILRDALKDEGTAALLLGSRIAARFTRYGLTEDLPQFHGHIPRPARFR